jgi:putative transcriptional regulator
MALEPPDTKDTYMSLLMGYAFGVLDQAQSMIVASHLTLSPRARALARTCEEMAGTLLEKDCQPVPMRSGALNYVLSAIDSLSCSSGKSACCAPKNKALPKELDLPEPLAEPMQSCTDFHWKTLGGGFKSYDLALDCCSSKARFVKLEPGLKTPEHQNDGMEITLILGGAVMEQGSIYRRGDLLVADETLTLSQQACPKAGCVCMVVSSSPVKLKGLAGILNPFLRF